jgi:hypothetical protein
MFNKTTIILFLSLLLFNGSILSQGRYDDDSKPFRFGFSLGLNAFDFDIQNSEKVIDGNVYQADVSNLKPGFSVGVITDMLLSRYLNLRFTPTLHFGERELNYGYVGMAEADRFTQNIPSVPISFPLYLKYSSERYGNIRPYLIGGGGIYFDLGQKKDEPIYLRTFDVFAEFGVGCDIYFSFFKLAPELKFALGFNDMFVPLDERAATLNPNDEKKSLAISKLSSRLITLTFNFE